MSFIPRINAFFGAGLRSFEAPLGIASLALLLVLAIAHPIGAHEFKAGELEIIHPASRATPEGARVAAGYVTIRNAGKEADRLVSATGEIAGRTEIHEMAVDGNGVMKMRQLPDGLEIPAGGEVSLAPGSFHLMFMDLKQGAKEGESFKGSLTFEKAGTVDVEFSVEAMGTAKGHGHSGH